MRERWAAGQLWLWLQMVLQGERSKEYAARRLEVEEKRLLIAEGERSQRRLLDEELRARQAQADSRRRGARDHQRLVSSQQCPCPCPRPRP